MKEIYLAPALYNDIGVGDMFEGHSLMPGLTDEPACFLMEETTDKGKLFGVYWLGIRMFAAEARETTNNQIAWAVTE